MVERLTLQSSTAIELALPKGGFSKEFLSAVREELAKCEELDSAYVLLKRIEHDDTTIFFCFLFGDGIAPDAIESRVASCMEYILNLFSEEIALDAACLNGRAELLAAVRSVTEPVFRR